MLASEQNQSSSTLTSNQSPSSPINHDAEQDAPQHQRIRRFSPSDDITDTVGAIAVDCCGNIAAASSSGGIGMKHKGRVGPAALVNIGTAVIPVDPGDKDKTSVAVVTSGTGEHIATTMAAGRCAERLYTSTRRTKRGTSESTDEETAMRSWVEREFIGLLRNLLTRDDHANRAQTAHPSVRFTPNHGAIGVMAVKKKTDGIFLHYAHNTDSFVS